MTVEQRDENFQYNWSTIEHPGYFGKKKDEQITKWNETYGEGNWRIAWELANGEVLDYEGIIYKIYVPGYVRHFLLNPADAEFLTQNYSYSYDKDLISREEAFDIYALYNKPGRANQFHNVALNIALEWYLGMPFKGEQPIQVREGKPGTSPEEQPEGYLWSPGRILTIRPELIPDQLLETVWWHEGTIEDLYQKSKVLQVKG